jgi:MraZ protein
MFIGEHISKLDNKGRVIFPAPLKRQLSVEQQQMSFVLKRDIYEKCLLLYPIKEWEQQISQLKKKLNPFNKKHAAFSREFYRGTIDVSLDNNNRLLLPKRLLDYMGADKEIVFAGQEGKIEIWAKEAYDDIQPSNETFALLVEEILGNNLDFFNE